MAARPLSLPFIAQPSMSPHDASLQTVAPLLSDPTEQPTCHRAPRQLVSSAIFILSVDPSAPGGKADPGCHAADGICLQQSVKVH
jgi:hypothetical protein